MHGESDGLSADMFVDGDVAGQGECADEHASQLGARLS